MDLSKFNVAVVPNSQMKLNVGSYYYFGDLCYVFEHDDWQAICDIIGGELDFCIEVNTEIKLKNGFIPKKIALASTDCGDGLYKTKKLSSLDMVQFNGSTPVDSGTIGFVEIAQSEEEFEQFKQQMSEYRRPVGSIFKATEEKSVKLAVISGQTDIGDEYERETAFIYNIAVMHNHKILIEAATDYDDFVLKESNQY